MLWKSLYELSPDGPSTLVEMLLEREAEAPEQAAYTFLGEGPTEAEATSETWSRRELLVRANAIASWLQQHAAPGDRALMLYPSGLDFVAAFYGCLLAGVVAVPAYPPDPTRLERSVPRLGAIAADAETHIILTTSALLGQTRELTARFPQLAQGQWLATDTLDDEFEVPMPAGVRPSTLAFFQYTSGSTGTPKGVMVTHANLVHNLRAFRDVLGLDADTSFVSWLPLFHDMGLIQGVLLALYVGSSATLMAPGTFIRSPLRWLQALSRHRRTMSAAPNFAYKLCLRKVSIRERDALDLSGWDIALNAAEPVRAETIEAFSSYFAPVGFRRQAFWPGFGLAEGTLMVTGNRRLSGPVVETLRSADLERGLVVRAGSPAEAGAIPYVACGTILPDHELAIVDPASGEPLPEARVGEIWSRGPSNAQGYWRRAPETEATFHGQITGRHERDWLRTGDLGFVLDGQLFISSRLKDLIIIRGRNHYPQDIELTVEQAHPAMRPGCGAAFSVEAHDEERLVIVQEIEPARMTDEASVYSAVLEALSANHELYPQAICLLKPGTLPKTSSGKIQRRGSREAYLQQKLALVGSWVRDQKEAITEPPPSRHVRRGVDRERIMAVEPARRKRLLMTFLSGQIASVLRLPSPWIDPDRSLAHLGFDSLTALELKNRLEVALDVLLPMVDFLRSPSLIELVELLQNQIAQGPMASRRSVIPAAAAPQRFMLSPNQSALWFLQKLSPGSAAYNVVLPVRITSPLEPTALRRAFDVLTERHPLLRATFALADDQPVQFIRPAGSVSWKDVDAEPWSEHELQHYLTEQAFLPFDLEHDPLFRVSLLRRGPREHVLLLTVHHAIIDFWSISTLMRELSTCYSSLRRGDEPEFEPLPMHFFDYVRWQMETLDGPAAGPLWAYWENELRGELPTLELPTDRPRPTMQTFRGASVPFRLTEELLRSLKAVAKRAGATLYMTLLASFQLLLARYTGQDDILVGSPSAGRGRADLVHLVGYFVNPLVMRTSFADNPGFLTLLGRVRDTVLGALEHDALPFPMLAQRLLSNRDPSRSPIFQAMFLVEREPAHEQHSLTPFALREAGARIELGELTLESMALEQRVSQFDLTLMLAESSDGMAGSFEYNVDLFDQPTIARMMGHFLNLLQAVVNEPERPVRQLPMLQPDEVSALLQGASGPQLPVPATTVHRLFEQQVARHPQAEAIEAAGRTLTYERLETESNQVAHLLLSLGLQPEERVGVCLDKTTDLAIALLGVLKAGGAYVPLDPEFPSDRLEYMVLDAGVRILLTSPTQQARTHLAAAVSLDITDRRLWSEQPGTPPPVEVSPQSLMYVLYTSGSTGRPKGVMIEHHAVVNFLASMERSPGLRAGDVLLSITTPSFDIFGLEFFLPLTVGAKVIFASRATAMDGNLMTNFLARSAVTALQGTPSALRLLTDVGGPLRSSIKILCGGEALPPALAETLLDRVGSLFNMYGPTETTIWSAVARLTPGQPITLGQPIDNTQLHVLDEGGQLVPPGVPGELYIGGEGLARGYLGLPELTAQRFVEIDLPTVGPRRLYRTGDLVRQTGAGDLLYLGRADHQVKLRGFRIELGDIESTLGAHPQVREAIVLARHDVPGGRLVAYFTSRDGAELAPFELRAFASKRLPEYMVPSLWVQVPSMPLTPNQKIDRRALALIDPHSDPGKPGEAAPPGSPLEALILDHWKQVLGLPYLSPDQNFFESGGHSMLAALAMTRLGKALQMTLPLHMIFTAPTATTMAHVIEALQREETPGSLASSEALEAQIQLDPALTFVPPSPSAPREVLLTGATGFLGAHLLRQLLDRTEARVHCLVRGSTLLGVQRMLENLQQYDLPITGVLERVSAISGDLDKPMAGLSPADVERLTDQLDAIYHNGALVDFIRPYRLLKSSNVLGTIELAKLASRGRPKVFHHVSTLSVFPSVPSGLDRTALEDDPLRLTAGDRIHGDYAESKWVADRVLMLARERGLGATIFRPGIVYGDALTGVGRTNDFVHIFLKGAIQLGAWPQLDTWINLTPVDFVASALVALSLRPDAPGKTFHLTSPTALPVEAFADMLRSYGYPLRSVPYRAWRAEIAATIEQPDPNSLVALLPYLSEDSGELFRQPFFDASNVLAGLDGTGIECPPADRLLVWRWLDHLVEVGFLPSPQRTRSWSPPPMGPSRA